MYCNIMTSQRSVNPFPSEVLVQVRLNESEYHRKNLIPAGFQFKIIDIDTE